MSEPRSLLMDVKVGQSLSLDGGRIVMTVEEKSGQRVKLRLQLPEDVKVDRAKPQSGALHARLGVLGIA